MLTKPAAAVVASAVTTVLALPVTSAAAATPGVSPLDKTFLQASAATDLAEMGLGKVTLAKATPPESTLRGPA